MHQDIIYFVVLFDLYKAQTVFCNFEQLLNCSLFYIYCLYLYNIVQQEPVPTVF